MRHLWWWKQNAFSITWWKTAITSGYLWKDSVSCYIYRWIICPLKGHQDPVLLDEESLCDGEAKVFCFACQKYLDS